MRRAPFGIALIVLVAVVPGLAPGQPRPPRSLELDDRVWWHVTRVAFSPDGALVATAGIAELRNGSTDVLAVWDAATGAFRYTAAWGADEFEFSPDSRSIAVPTGAAAGIVVLDAVTGKERWWAGHPKATMAVFSPDGRSLATWKHGDRFAKGKADTDTIRVWDTTACRQRFEIVAPEHQRLGHFEFVPDGRLAVATDRSRIRLFDDVTGRESPPFTAKFLDPEHPYFLTSTDGNRWLVPGVRPHLIDPNDGKEPRAFGRLGDRYGCIRLSPDGTRVAAVLAKDQIVVWDATTGDETAKFPLPDGRGREVGFDFTPDGRYLVVRRPESLQLWVYTPTGRLVRSDVRVSALEFDRAMRTVAVVTRGGDGVADRVTLHDAAA